MLATVTFEATKEITTDQVIAAINTNGHLNAGYISSNGNVIYYTCAVMEGGLSFTGQVLLGDLDNSGILNIADAFLLYRAVSGQTVLTSDQERFADMDRNGILNIADAYALYRMVSGAE